MTDPIELIYDLQALPAGRIPFHRWRWELWHGQHMLAAGWRLHPLQAQRALRQYALRHAHRIHGVHVLRADAGNAPETAWAGRAVEVASGDVRVRLMPRGLAEEMAAA
jgi:hypothetical protein